MSDRGAAVRLVARASSRRRWRSLVILALLAAATAGVATAAIDGAHRSSSAYDRLHEEARGADAIVFATFADIFDADWTGVLEDPSVEAAGTFSLAPVALDGPGLGPDPAFVLPPSGSLFVDLERPVISEGRRPDPDRRDEVWLSEAAADSVGVRVGDRLRLVTFLDLAAFFGDVDDARPGPSFPVTVTGIGTVPTDFTWMTEGQAGVSRTVLADNPDVPAAANLVVRLREGGAGMTDLRAAVDRHVGAAVPILDLSEAGTRVSTSTTVEANGLLLFAAAVVASGGLLVGQAVVRWVQAQAAELGTLGALGLDRRELATALALPLVPTALLAAALGVALAFMLSTWFPIGLARQIEPDPGRHAEPWLWAAAALLTVVFVLGVAAVTARNRVTHLTTARRGRSVTEEGLARLGLPLPLATGARFALVTGRGADALPVGPALVGGVVAVAGVVAAFTFLVGVDTAVADSTTVGPDVDAVATSTGQDLDLDGRALAALAADPAVGPWAVETSSVARLAGEPTPLFALDGRRGTWTYRVLAGRAPGAPDEVVLGPDTAEALAVDVGDTVSLTDDASARVVGLALLQQGVHFSYDQGAWLTPAGLARVAADTGATVTESAALRWEPGADRAGATARLAAVGLAVEEPALPQTLRHLTYVRPLPVLLAWFLGLLGLAAVGHALVAAVRRRRHELAVLRVLGMAPRQARLVSTGQAMVVALVGLALGLPLGHAMGRAVWRWVALNAPLYYLPPTALVAMLLVAVGTLVAANVLAAAPGHRAAHLRPTVILRAD